MTRKGLIRLVVPEVLLVLCFAGRGWADVSYTVPESTYGQEFNTLATSGHSNPWMDDVTIPGWFANRTSYGANDGSIHGNDLEAYGSTGSSERALGARPSVGDVHFGVRFTNDTGVVLNGFRVMFDGEQWFDAANAGPDVLLFSYQIGTNPSLTSPGFVNVSSLDFTAPVVGSTSMTLNGNNPANRTAGITGVVGGFTWNPGEQLLLRWTNDDSDQTSDESIGIDNFSFSASVPEPSSLIPAGLAVTLALLRRSLDPRGARGAS